MGIFYREKAFHIGKKSGKMTLPLLKNFLLRPCSHQSFDCIFYSLPVHVFFHKLWTVHVFQPRTCNRWVTNSQVKKRLVRKLQSYTEGTLASCIFPICPDIEARFLTCPRCNFIMIICFQYVHATRTRKEISKEDTHQLRMHFCINLASRGPNMAAIEHSLPHFHDLLKVIIIFNLLSDSSGHCKSIGHCLSHLTCVNLWPL